MGLTGVDKYDRTLVSGVKYPVFAASACSFWVLTRILYTLGYTTGDPAKVRHFSRDMSYMCTLHDTHVHLDSEANVAAVLGPSPS